jgi:hypothetical protein
MNRSSVMNTLFWALSFGGLIAVLTGEQRAVSLRVWLASLVVWFAVASVRRLLEGIPLVPARIRSLIAFRRKSVVVDNSRLREVRVLEGLLLRAKDNDRAYLQQLHPRVVTLADHFLPVTHGIDRHSQPERAAELFGPLGWLLNPDSHDRTPTLAELDDLLELLTIPSSTRTEEAA